MKHNMTVTGTVFDISRYCLNDGPGIRTTVFFKGCPLRCAWCHNPESQSVRPEIMFSQNICSNCGECAAICPHGCHTVADRRLFDREKCIGCGACASVCKTGSLRTVGKRVTAEEIMSEVLKDRVFYKNSGGGLTVSGGEPLVQIDFLEHLLRLARSEGIHTAVETCGYAPRKSFEQIVEYTDLFLFDFKESDFDKHLLFTGKSPKIILENLSFLNGINANIILRLPLIPGYNDMEEHVKGIRELIGKFHSIKKAEVLPYHPLGVSKEADLGWQKKKAIETPTKEALDNFILRIRDGLDIDADVCI